MRAEKWEIMAAGLVKQLGFGGGGSLLIAPFQIDLFK
jgi:hypothetical protein